MAAIDIPSSRSSPLNLSPSIKVMTVSSFDEISSQSAAPGFMQSVGRCCNASMPWFKHWTGFVNAAGRFVQDLPFRFCL